MRKQILVTGGAGFIGSHLADELLAEGYAVRVFDNLCPQVHGPDQRRPQYLNSEAELVVGDVRDAEALRKALKGIDAVFHLAAMVGVGQSMYEVAQYTAVNNQGTANLMQALIEQPVQKLVVASSMSIYGEGLYRTPAGDLLAGNNRSLKQLKARDWELRDLDGEILTPVATPETKLPSLASIYALSKYDQERMCLIMGQAYRIPTVALRFFNVYGTRQALSNPYTGVMAIFASRLMNGKPPLIFEDGRQQRDFISVHDVARACRLALETPKSSGCALNVGSGEHYTIGALGERIAAVMGKEEIEPSITGKYRVGDVRHCFADTTQARRILKYEAQVTLEDGLRELVAWLESQVAVDHVDQASAELSARGLTV
jgi:dTDP-L-rhamnose 4-epimerase